MASYFWFARENPLVDHQLEHPIAPVLVSIPRFIAPFHAFHESAHQLDMAVLTFLRRMYVKKMKDGLKIYVKETKSKKLLTICLGVHGCGIHRGQHLLQRV